MCKHSSKHLRALLRQLTTLITVGSAALFTLGCDQQAATVSGGTTTTNQSTATSTSAPSTKSPKDLVALQSKLASAEAAFSLEPSAELLGIVSNAENALQDNPAQSIAISEIRVLLGTLWTRLGRPDRAIAQLGKVVDLKQVPSTQPVAPSREWPNLADRARLALADAFVTCGAFADAERQMRLATESDVIFDMHTATQPAKSISPFFDRALEVRVQIHLAAGELGPASVRAELVYNIRKDRDGEAALPTRLAKLEHWRQRATLGGQLQAEPALADLEKECEQSPGPKSAIAQLARLTHAECEMRIAGRFVAALADVEASAKELVGLLPPGSRYLRSPLNRAIETLEYRREWDRSEALLRMAANRIGSDGPLTLPSVRVELARRLAENYQRRGNLESAKKQIDTAIKTAKGARDTIDLVDAHAAALQTAADIARRQKQYGEAHALIGEAIQMRQERALDEQSPMQAWAEATRAWILMNEGDFTTSEDEMTRITPILRERLGEADWRTGQARLLLGELKYKQMKLEEAEEDIVYGSRILVGRRGGDEDGIHSLRLCVDFYEMSGNVEMATHYRRLLPENHDHDHGENGD